MNAKEKSHRMELGLQKLRQEDEDRKMTAYRQSMAPRPKQKQPAEGERSSVQKIEQGLPALEEEARRRDRAFNSR